MNFPSRDTSTVVTIFKDQNSKHSNPVFKESIAVVNITVFCLIAYSVSQELRIKSALKQKQNKWAEANRFCPINNVRFLMV